MEKKPLSTLLSPSLPEEERDTPPAQPGLGEATDGCHREKMRFPKQAELDIYSSLKITKESYLSSWEIASCSKLGHYILRALGLT